MNDFLMANALLLTAIASVVIIVGGLFGARHYVSSAARWAWRSEGWRMTTLRRDTARWP